VLIVKMDLSCGRGKRGCGGSAGGLWWWVSCACEGREAGRQFVCGRGTGNRRHSIGTLSIEAMPGAIYARFSGAARTHYEFWLLQLCSMPSLAVLSRERGMTGMIEMRAGCQAGQGGLECPF
jgi:hypothetical protein